MMCTWLMWGTSISVYSSPASMRAQASSSVSREAIDETISIARATGNEHFADFMQHLGETIIPRARVNTAKLAGDDFAQYLYRVNREHEDIYNAIRRQDPEAARAAMRTHLSNSRERLVRVQEEAERAAAG